MNSDLSLTVACATFAFLLCWVIAGMIIRLSNGAD